MAGPCVGRCSESHPKQWTPQEEIHGDGRPGLFLIPIPHAQVGSGISLGLHYPSIFHCLCTLLSLFVAKERGLKAQRISSNFGRIAEIIALL